MPFNHIDYINMDFLAIQAEVWYNYLVEMGRKIKSESVKFVEQKFYKHFNTLFEKSATSNWPQKIILRIIYWFFFTFFGAPSIIFLWSRARFTPSLGIRNNKKYVIFLLADFWPTAPSLQCDIRWHCSVCPPPPPRQVSMVIQNYLLRAFNHARNKV